MQTGHTLASLLEPYRSQAVADATGTSRQVAHSWRTGSNLPDVRSLPRLASFLNLDLAELTRIVAIEAGERFSAAVA
jgi:transcriptional regulator with XRE-family HTH domain